MLKEYTDYIKDNPKGYWFKAKLYGWGWTPANWKGWLTVLIFIVLVALNSFRIDSDSYPPGDAALRFITQTGLLVVILILICWKTGEKPRWQWGPPRKN